MYILYALFANINVLTLEYVYRVGTFNSFVSSVPYTIVPILLAQWALFMLFKTAPTYMLAWAMFAVGNAVLRLIPNYYLNEGINMQIIAGIGFMVGGMYLIKLGNV